MSARAVSEWVVAQLQNKTIGNFQPLVVADELPQSGQKASTNPAVFVWIYHSQERRKTMSGPAGFKETTHHLYVSCHLLMRPDATHSFRDLLEGVKDTFRQLVKAGNIQVVVTDSVTGKQSTIVNVGEEMDATYDPPQATKDQRYDFYSGIVEMTMTEWFIP
ncbi:MAG: hypothetical protein KGL39_24245 [Patescibacteria group bacterium]|nr:hypothetical protein [Patescibacteria group bacterium]